MSPSFPVGHVSLAYLQGNVESHAAWRRLTRRLLLARCAIQGSGGRGAGGGGARSRGGRGGGWTPCSAAWGAGRGADGSRGLGPRHARLLLAGLLLLLGLQRLTTDVMVLLPVLVLAEGAAVARRVAAAARLAGFAAAVPAALMDTRMKLTQTTNSVFTAMSEARMETHLNTA